MNKPCFDGCEGKPGTCSEGDPGTNCRHLKAGGTWDNCMSGALSPCPKFDPWLSKKLQAAEQERDELERERAEICVLLGCEDEVQHFVGELVQERDKWLKWAATVDCLNPKWPPVSTSSESSNCGECVPCKARVAWKGGGR